MEFGPHVAREHRTPAPRDGLHWLAQFGIKGDKPTLLQAPTQRSGERNAVLGRIPQCSIQRIEEPSTQVSQLRLLGLADHVRGVGAAATHDGHVEAGSELLVDSHLQVLACLRVDPAGPMVGHPDQGGDLGRW